MATNSQIIKIPIPSPIPDNYQFKELEELNKLLTGGYQIIQITQSISTDKKDLSLVVSLKKENYVPPFYTG